MPERDEPKPARVSQPPLYPQPAASLDGERNLQVVARRVVVIAVEREWSPLAADRFYNHVKNGFYNDSRFFRVLDVFMSHFGLHADT